MANAERSTHTTRRLFLTGSPLALLGAASTVASVPAMIMASDDPIHAAIRDHKNAAAAFDAHLQEHDGDGDEATYLRLDDADRNAMFALAGTIPVTREGAKAALHHLVKEAGDRHYRVLGIFGANLIKATFAA